MKSYNTVAQTPEQYIQDNARIDANINNKSCMHISSWDLVKSAPMTSSLLLAGTIGYSGLLDEHVSRSLPDIKTRLSHWSAMYGVGKKFFPVLSGVITIGGIVMFVETRQKLWLLGAAMTGLFYPWTGLFMLGINNRLYEINSGQEDPAQRKAEAEQLLASWWNRHRVRVMLAVGACVCFFMAEKATK